jgi:mono/diheme cytochrome c family protein
LEVERVNAKSGRFVGWLVILSFVVVSSLVGQQAAKSTGSNVFRTKCVLCHGADGSGKTPLGKQLQAADLRSKEVQKRGDAELHKIIHDGQANMPAFADQLSESEIDQVLKHVRALGKTAPAKK